MGCPGGPLKTCMEQCSPDVYKTCVEVDTASFTITNAIAGPRRWAAQGDLSKHAWSSALQMFTRRAWRWTLRPSQ